MNWRVSWLDNYTLISNSDAHSPPKLAREATLFDTDLCYDALFDALRSRDPSQFLGTIEFFPEEGKYHLDGHRKCGVCWEPVTTVANKGLCPTCADPSRSAYTTASRSWPTETSASIRLRPPHSRA